MISTTRRGFLLGLLAAPFVAKAELIMPVRSLVQAELMPGDLVDFDRGTFRKYGVYAICEPVKRIEGDMVVTSGCGGRGEITIPRSAVSLFHGLPGNRVNNPSMRHRLIRQPGRIGLAYPEDVRPSFVNA